MTWFRLYHDLIDDPKIQLLPIELRWRWIEVLCISSRGPDSERGSLPDMEHVAFHMKLSVAKARDVIDQLIAAGLIDKTQGSKKLSIHGWDKRQYKSDNITSRWRKHKANVELLDVLEWFSFLVGSLPESILEDALEQFRGVLSYCVPAIKALAELSDDGLCLKVGIDGNHRVISFR